MCKLTYKHTLIGKFIPNGVISKEGTEYKDTFNTTAVFIEIIGITVYFCPTFNIPTRAITISPTVFCFLPHARCEFSVFLKMISYAT